MKDDDLCDSDPQSLTQMMNLDAGDQKLWGPEELGAILEHQLAAPLVCDLGSLDKGLVRRLKEFNSAGGTPLTSFEDLLHHPSPPVEFLELTKRFAKLCRSDHHVPLPGEIATVLYFLSIVVAMTRCGRRITKMDDRSLQYSLSWAIRQPWLDDSSRRIIEEGLREIGSSGPGPE